MEIRFIERYIGGDKYNCPKCGKEFNLYERGSVFSICTECLMKEKLSDNKLKENKYEPEPLCPSCYNGKIVEDANVAGIFFCDSCFEEIKIKKWQK